MKIVALGGGHGLHASLTALRLITDDLTAVVTVADDGGSSGRIRRELKVLPPGDLRMAVAALAADDSVHQRWAEVIQHRIGGTGALAGHPVGNLILTGLLERETDPVAALDQLGTMVGAIGRVLPMSPIPLDLVADVDRFDTGSPEDTHRVRQIRGQSSIASTPGRVRAVHLLPAGAPACPAAVDAVRAADAVILGPGSWFTSVIPHLLLRELGRALASTQARVVVNLNLAPQVGETDGYSPADLLRVLLTHAEPFGGLTINAVVADPTTVPDHQELQGFVHGLGARLVLSDLTAEDSAERHDPVKLSGALRKALDPMDRWEDSGAEQREGTHAWR